MKWFPFTRDNDCDYISQSRFKAAVMTLIPQFVWFNEPTGQLSGECTASG